MFGQDTATLVESPTGKLKSEPQAGTQAMAITNPKSVDQYIKMVCELRAALENISEFVGTLPAPDDDHNIPGMNYAQLGDIARLHELVGEACQVTCEVGGY
jgi:hypothetical protein